MYQDHDLQPWQLFAANTPYLVLMEEVESIHQSLKGKPGKARALSELGTRSASTETAGFSHSLNIRYSEETETGPKETVIILDFLVVFKTTVLAVVAMHGILTA